MIGLIGAMPMEVEPLIKRLEDHHCEQAGPFEFHLGMLAGAEAVVMCCGISKVNAAMSTQALLMRYQPERIIHLGVGGGLIRGLDVCDVVVARDCIQYDVDTSVLGDPPGFVSTVDRIDFPCDPQMTAGILRAGAALRKKGRKVLEARVATGDRFLSDSDEKRKIVEEFGALLCDQESCAVAQVCFVNGVPFAVVRAVSDASDGEHAAEYANYMPKAAKIAADLVWKYLANIYK